jgi:hypothetical protein
MTEAEELVLLVKLVNHVIRHGEVYHARKRFRVAGLPIYYDKVWFPPKGRDSYTVAGKSWSATLHFLKDGKGGNVILDQWRRHFDAIKIVNREAMLKDLTLLRLFGVETIFSSE